MRLLSYLVKKIKSAINKLEEEAKNNLVTTEDIFEEN